MWQESRTFVIAEAGVNHNGSLATALALVDAAAAAGADAVKFQTFRADRLATRTARKADYQAVNTGAGGGQLEMLRRLELSIDDHQALVARCNEQRIRFMSTAFDEVSLDFIATLPVPAIKVPSGDLTAGPLLWRAARLRRPLIVSTGMATLGEVEQALAVIAHALTRNAEPQSWREIEAAWLDVATRDALRERVVLLHCVTAYPAPPAEVNLRAMDVLAAAFGLPVGYSDHTLGSAVALAAVARGASVLEKHVTLDRAMPGPDHAASLEPDELKTLIADVRCIEAALGEAAKRPVPSEVGNRAVARRSLVATRAIHRGERLCAADLAIKRPADGRSPMRYWDALGQPAAADVEPDEPVTW
jgi:N-acetylneuraminate synthase